MLAFREKLKKAYKAKDSYSLVMEKVRQSNALKKQHIVDTNHDNSLQKGKVKIKNC